MAKHCSNCEQSIHRRAKTAGWAWTAISVGIILALLVQMQTSYGGNIRQAWELTELPYAFWIGLFVFNLIFAALMLVGQKKKYACLYFPYLIFVGAELVLALVGIVLLTLYLTLIGAAFAHNSNVLVFGLFVAAFMAFNACVFFYWFVVIPSRSLRRLNRYKGHRIVHASIHPSVESLI